MDYAPTDLCTAGERAGSAIRSSHSPNCTRRFSLNTVLHFTDLFIINDSLSLPPPLRLCNLEVLLGQVRLGLSPFTQKEAVGRH